MFIEANMDDSHNIKNLEEVLRNHVKKHRKIVKTDTKALTAPGENFGSIMLKLDITLRSETDGSEEEIHAVAKTLPTDEFAREIFNIQVTCKNEIAMYDTIVPLMQEFQKENGVNQIFDHIPKLYGARINLGNENGTVDDDAVLILENLVAQGYEVVDRHKGFDLETGQLILKSLAAFHAIPLALKLKKPNVFEKKIKPYLSPFIAPYTPWEEKLMFIEIIQDSYKCIPYIPKVTEIFKKQNFDPDAPLREPFSTVTHGDMWVNNTMIKFEKGVPIDNKLVDFQVCDYKSPTTDLFFFLFSSVQLSVLQESLDDLIKFYYKHFILHLEQLKCDTTPFSFDRFQEEMAAAAVSELLRTTVMLTYIVLGKKGGPSNPDMTAPRDFKKIMKDISLTAKEKTRFMVHASGVRGWFK